MEVKVCRNCKKIFQYVAGPEICLQCRQEEEELFQKVKAYLREHPGANTYEVTQETGVSPTLIEKFLRQGRLEVAPESALALGCERCGKKIKTGRYCSDCTNEVTNQLNEVKRMLVASNKEGQDSSPRMRYLGSNKINKSNN